MSADTPGLQAIEKVLSCQSTSDIEGLAAVLADDFVLDLPYAIPGMPSEFDRQGYLDLVASSLDGGLFAELEFSLVGLYPSTAEGEEATVFVEYESAGRFAADDQPYANRYVGKFVVRGDRLAYWREYMDPRPLEVGVAKVSGA